MKPAGVAVRLAALALAISQLAACKSSPPGIRPSSSSKSESAARSPTGDSVRAVNSADGAGGSSTGDSVRAVNGSDPEFGAWWHDGRAELDGYRLTIIRYGQPRRGQAMLVYVTEPFSESKRVKVDNAAANPGDTFDVLKLNLVRDFQTGIYDYNTMVSLFVRSADFEPVKESFSSAEWCGHVYQETIFGPREISQRYFSYFENESSAHSLEFKRQGVVEENLFILLRGLNGPFLNPGQKRSVDFLPGPFYSRLTHLPAAWTKAELRRLPSLEEIEVPAGRFSTIVYAVTTGDGRAGRFNVEQAYPHRIVRWSWQGVGDAARGAGREGGAAETPGAPAEAMDSGELAGSSRLEYWKLHDNGNEGYLKELGIEPTVR